MTSLKPTGKVPRMLGHCGGVPGPVPSRSHPCCRPLPSIHGKAPAAPVPCGPSGRRRAAPPVLTAASADSFVLGPGLEENSFPKKQLQKMWKKSTPQASAEWGREVLWTSRARGRMRRALARGQERTGSPVAQGARRHAPVPVPSCPLLAASGTRLPGELRPLERLLQRQSVLSQDTWSEPRMLSADPQRASVLSDAGLPGPLGATRLPAVSSSLPTLAGYVRSHLTLAVTGEWGSR